MNGQQSKMRKARQVPPPPTKPPVVELAPVPIDDHCLGERWVVEDEARLAELIAIIAMGQAVHADKIIQELRPATPALTQKALCSAAKRQLRIVGKTEEQLNSARWRRDGFIFEAISWIAARQSSGENAFLKDPHLKSTTQGIDGLMIEMNAAKNEVSRATIFEDKCSENPRTIFRDQVLPGFRDHHNNSRAPELVATAAALIVQGGLLGEKAVAAAARVLDLAYRRYRAALTVKSKDDSQVRRKAIFKDYDELDQIGQPQRIGATLIVDGDLRDYFDRLADRVIAVVQTWEEKEA